MDVFCHRLLAFRLSGWLGDSDGRSGRPFFSLLLSCRKERPGARRLRTRASAIGSSSWFRTRIGDGWLPKGSHTSNQILVLVCIHTGDIRTGLSLSRSWNNNNNHHQEYRPPRFSFLFLAERKLTLAVTVNQIEMDGVCRR